MQSIAGLQQVLSENRPALLRYFRAHGVEDLADDLLQELWIRAGQATGPVANPLGYLYRIATNLVIDHRRSARQAQRRDRAWSLAHDRDSDAIAQEPSSDRVLASRQALAAVERRLADLPARARTIFLRHRVDGLTQRELVAELGVSRSTVEADLRLVYQALRALREDRDEE